MRLGCCLNMGSFVPQAGAERAQSDVERAAAGLKIVKGAGFDFVELTVGLVMNLSEHELSELADAHKAVGIVPEAFNSFVPGTMRVTGPDVDRARVLEYIDQAAQRVAGLGGKIIVFGSGKARSMPDGWELERAREQFAELLREVAPIARRYDVVIAIEPLNKSEDNVINSVAEGVALAEAVDCPEVQVLADLYHMEVEGEPYETVRDFAHNLVHVHVADTGRRAPGTGDWDYRRFFRELDKGEYVGAVSIECSWENFTEQAAPAYQALRRAWDGRWETGERRAF